MAAAEAVREEAMKAEGTAVAEKKLGDGGERACRGRKRPSGGEGGPGCESTKDHGALKKRKVLETAREADGGGRVLRKRSAADVLKDNVSDNETHCAHKRGKYEQASKAVWSECEPWRDK